MRKLLTVVLVLTVLPGCPRKPSSGECKSSADCVEQQGSGQICVAGRCQGCGSDSDCMAGFVCRTNQCTPKPQCASSADCPQGHQCQQERCVFAAPGRVECRADADCPEGRECNASQCVQRAASAAPGCALASVAFGFRRTSLTAEAQAALRADVECLQKNGARRVTIAGNTDEREGDARACLALGATRAEVVRRYLSDLGMGVGVDTVSYGREKPVCSQATPDCRARNRRVELVADGFQITGATALVLDAPRARGSADAPRADAAASTGRADDIWGTLDFGLFRWEPPPPSRAQMDIEYPVRVTVYPPSVPVGTVSPEGSTVGASTSGPAPSPASPPTPVRIGKDMSARLYGDGFSVTPGVEDRRTMVSTEPTTWRWTVTPKKPGKHRLILELKVHQADVNRPLNQEFEVEVFVPDKTLIELLVSWWDRLNNFVKVPIGAALIGWAWTRWKRRRPREHEAEES